MDTFPQPHQPAPPLDLPRLAYYQLIHTLTSRLPPPLADTHEALLARNQAAIAQVAAMLPTNPDEAALAALCVATRAQADDVLRSLRVHAGDINVVIRLNAQYISMVRTSLAAHGHLQRTQAVRHKREATTATCNADEWTQLIAADSMQQVLDAGPLPATGPSAPAQAAEPPALAPAAPDPAAQQPAPVPAEAPPPMPEAEPPAPALVFAPVAARRPPPAAPMRPAAPPRSRHRATPAEADDPPRDLPAEADYYAVVYPYRAREIRHYGGLPPDCSYGPPDDDLVHAIVTSTSPALRALDGANAATG